MIEDIGCFGKDPFRSRVLADRVIRDMGKKKGLKRAAGTGRLESYRCRVCGQWHIGSKQFK